jgi:XTP/dITP diphosphohydrolase
MMKILVASSNSGKLRDFSGAASLYKVEFELIPNFKQLPEAVEDGETFADNARKKSEHYSCWVAHRLVLADDSGLEADALGGAPGVHSARYAGLDTGLPDNSNSGNSNSNSKDEANNARLLRELAGVEDARRGARFVSVISVARDGQEVASFRGEAEGVLLRSPKGNNGFGYDPLFWFAPLGKTFAELTPEEKATVSHRGEAIRKFLEWCSRGRR